MEVCVPRYTSVCQDVSSKSGSSIGPNNPTDYSSSDISLNELKTSVDVYVNIQEAGIPHRGLNLSPKNNKNNPVSDDKCKDTNNSKSIKSAEKFLAKCATFPPPSEPKCSVNGIVVGKKDQEDGKTIECSEVNGNPVPANQCYSRSASLPNPLKLVSALKGSREKQGIPPKTLSVTWSPDVYDPTPTSVSHVPSYRNQRGRSDGRKHGKNKQKGGGKSSRGSKGKDKKQARKNSGCTNKLRPLHDEIGVVGFNEPQTGILDFNVGGSPDPFCGSSFLKNSVTKLHFPVAEAT